MPSPPQGVGWGKGKLYGLFAPHAASRAHIIPKDQNTADSSCGCDKPSSSKKTRISWASLLKRVFRIDIDICTTCGARMKIISAITDRIVIAKILNHIGVGPDPPPISPAKTLPDPHPDFYTHAAMETHV